MLYLLGTAVTSRFEAVLATTILTVSYHHIWFSQNARGYTALLFWVLLATFLLLRWFSRTNNSLLIGYAVVAALGSYTHLTMVFVVVSHAFICIWVLFVHKTAMDAPRDWRYLAAAFVSGGLLTLLLYAPVIQDVQTFYTDVPNTQRVATPLWAFWEAVSGLRVGFGALWVVALGGATCCAGLLSYFAQKRVIFGYIRVSQRA